MRLVRHNKCLFLFLFLAPPSVKCCQDAHVPNDCIVLCTPSTTERISKNDGVEICNPFLDAIFKCRKLAGPGEGMVEFKIGNLRSIIMKLQYLFQMIIMFSIILARIKVMKSCSEYDAKIVKGDLEHARSTCDLYGDRCLGVQDPGCDGKPNFYLCPKTAVLKESSNSCFYFRGT